MAATVEQYLAIAAKAYAGSIKLPAFQRKWRWKPSQVVLLFDSLRQGYPIGSFLFIKDTPDVDLGPREFQHASQKAKDARPEQLVLDGQQRITAGLELFYDCSDTQYFIDINRVHTLFTESGVDIENTAAIRTFLTNLEAEDQYCVAKKSVKDPESLLLKRGLLWTKILVDDIELERCLKKYSKVNPDREDFISYVIGKNFRPGVNAHVPITLIDGDVTVEAISRIFSTLNSTGKMLTPFELVVSVLFPHQVNLSEDVETARAVYTHYNRIDTTGDILLQTIALFDGKETRKAALPKTITAANYRFHFNEAVKFLDEAGKLLTERIGLGLDQSNDLLVYPVIFSPMAFVLKALSGRSLSAPERAAAEHKLAKWFIGAVLTRRYQQSTHDKQAKDKTEILDWIDRGDDALPQWLRDAWIPNLKNADPDGATGKLLRALQNAKNLRDPFTGKPVGVGSGKQTSAKHHVFPTRFVANLDFWTKTDSANRALNIMYCEESTNGSWLNLDPALQVKAALNVDSSMERIQETYLNHGIGPEALELLQKPQKTRDDFYTFLELRERYFITELEKWGFREPVAVEQEDSTDIIED